MRLLLVAIVLLVTGCDQATKSWAEDELAGAPPAEIVAGRVDLTYAENHGVAFNTERVLPEGARGAVVVLAGLGGLAMLSVFWWRRRGEVSARTAGYALVLGGAAGNLIDRAARGHVVDFVHVHGWPIFNVADVAIGAGIALILLAEARRGATAS
jgi:signal peptidase II